MANDLIRLMHVLFFPAVETVREVIWQPATDIYRTADGWLLKFDLAGVQPEDIHLELQGNQLRVFGTRRDCCCVEEGCCHYQMEIPYSGFERIVLLPVDREPTRVVLEHRLGLLLVRIRMEASET